MTWVAVGISAVGAVTSLAGGISGKKAAEKAGEMQAKVITQTAQENERRRKLDLQSKLGSIKAGIYASNLQFSGTARKYTEGFESQYRGEMAWDKQKARIEARMAEKGGGMAGQQAMYSGLGSAIGFTGSAASGIVSAMSPKKTGSP